MSLDSFIDNLRQHIDIVDLIKQYVPLKKAGVNYQACCPFHKEKTPSFVVFPNEQDYHCFGCGAHGTAVQFVKDHLGLTFKEAIQHLAGQASIPIPSDLFKSKSKQEIIEDKLGKEFVKISYDFLELTTKYFQQQLKISDLAKDYLKNQRHLTGEIAKEFKLGYAPAGWNHLLDYFKSFYKNIDEKTLIDQLLLLGLIKKNDREQYYDAFRHRIMFPIFNTQGKVIAFGGRILDPNDKPKYLNSPESEFFNKSEELYGLFQARKTISQLKQAIVVEGNLDVISLHQYGFTQTVASLGTAINLKHIRILNRYAEEILFCFDGDEAGRKAGWRALEHCLTLLDDTHQYHFIFLPEGEDPDSMAQRQVFAPMLKQKMALSDYFIQKITQNLDFSIEEHRIQLIKKIKPYIESMPDCLLKNLIIKKIADKSHFDLNELNHLLGIQSHRNHDTNESQIEDQNVQKQPIYKAFQPNQDENETKSSVQANQVHYARTRYLYRRSNYKNNNNNYYNEIYCKKDNIYSREYMLLKYLLHFPIIINEFEKYKLPAFFDEEYANPLMILISVLKQKRFVISSEILKHFENKSLFELYQEILQSSFPEHLEKMSEDERLLEAKSFIQIFYKQQSR